MSDYTLQMFNNPALKVKCRAVTLDDDVAELVQAMMRVMLQSCGIGLAAPQVGSDLRVIIVGRKAGNGIAYRVMVNPRLRKWSKQSCFADEGCLSFPGVKAWVKRHKRVKVTFTDHVGCIQKHSLTGHEARVFQHELDHLDGVCLVGDEWRRQNRGIPELTEVQSSVL